MTNTTYILCLMVECFLTCIIYKGYTMVYKKLKM